MVKSPPANAGDIFQSLVPEDFIYRRATKPERRNHRAHEPHLLNRVCLRACALRQEKLLQRGACIPQLAPLTAREAHGAMETSTGTTAEQIKSHGTA